MRCAGALVLVLLAGCHGVFGLQHVDFDDRFCAEPEQRDATFCADFDQSGGDPFAGLFFADDKVGEAYFIDTQVVHSAPNAASLVIAGAGSPDARLGRNLADANRFSGSVWMRFSHNETNSVVLFRAVFGTDLATTSVGVRSSGRVFDSPANRTLAMLTPMPKDAWFEITFAFDASDPSAATFELAVDGDVTSGTFVAGEGPRRLMIGPAEPSPDNQNAGWRVASDDIVVRVTR